MTSLFTDYTSFPDFAEKVWAAWFSEDLTGRTRTSDQTIEVVLRAPHLEPPVMARMAPKEWVLSLQSAIDNLGYSAKIKVAWNKLLHRHFASALPVYHIGRDGSLEQFPLPTDCSNLKLSQSVVMFASPGSQISGTLVLPTEVVNEFIASLVMPKPTSNPSADLAGNVGHAVEAAPPVTTDKPRGGAPPKHDAEAFLIEAFRLLYEGFVPKSPADLRRRTMERYWERKLQSGEPLSDPPSDEWAKPKIRKLWSDLHLDRDA